jgi:hypothetical protein
MTDKFEEEIKNIARRSRKCRSAPEYSDTDREFLGAIEEFYVLARRAITYFNGASEGMRLSLLKLTQDSLDLFLDIQGRRGGFSISSPSGIVVLFDEDPNVLTVIGRKRKNDRNGEGKLTSAIQLIKISFRKENGVFVYMDNSGGAIDPHDIVALLIRWVSSA